MQDAYRVPSALGSQQTIPTPSHQPVPALASLRRGLEQPWTLSLGALPSLVQRLGVARKECPLRTGPAPPCPWPLLGPWPGGCREALSGRDRQENAELSLARREEGLVCEAACSGDRTQHTPCQLGEERKPWRRGGTGKKMLPQLGELSPLPRSPRGPARLPTPARRLGPAPCSGSVLSQVSPCPSPRSSRPGLLGPPRGSAAAGPRRHAEQRDSSRSFAFRLRASMR